MDVRKKIAAGAVGAVLAATAFGVTFGGGGSVDVFVGSTPTPTSTPTGTPTPYPTVANVFVDRDGGTCGRSSTAIAYNTSTACGTFDAAYAAAHQGDLVLVKQGGSNYPAQTIADDSSKHTGVCDVGNTSPCVTIAAYPGETPTLVDLTNHAWNAYYDGFAFVKTATTGDPSDGGPSITQGTGVVMANMNATQFYIAGQSSTNPTVNAHIYGGTFGPLVTCPGGGIPVGIDGATQTWEMPKNVTIEGVYVHDLKVTGGCGQDHMDCVHVRATTGFFRFLRNKFLNCQDYALLLEGSPDSAWDVTVANNMVGPNIAGTDSIALRGDQVTPPNYPGTVRFLNNSADGGISPAVNNTVNSMVIANNYAPTVGACRSPGFTYSHNIMSSGPACGTGDATGTTFGWVNRSTGDLHLTGGASAINNGDNTYCPTVDFDNETRTGTCDVGADQP